MSFRSTTSATNFTNRGFRIIVDRNKKKVRFVFDSSQTDVNDKEISEWLNWVDTRVGLGPIDPEPYWGFDDLKYAIGEKLKNCFYIVADSEIEDKREYFLYKDLYILSGFSFKNFLKCIENSSVLIDFDARTGHNHGTKFRLKQGMWKDVYSKVEKVI